MCPVVPRPPRIDIVNYERFRNVCRKQETLQLDLEKAEDHLSAKNNHRDQLVETKRIAAKTRCLLVSLFLSIHIKSNASA